MTPPRVLELRKKLEERNYQGSKRFFQQLTDEHRKLVGPVPSSRPVYIGDKQFLSGFDRVVIGSHGPYIEFDAAHSLILLLPRETEEWRDDSPRAKYAWLYPDGFPDIKVYLQLRPVKYASYVVGKYYVDYWAVESRVISSSPT